MISKHFKTLPGVGVKTAKVVMNVLYDASLVAVDTHIHRVSNRLGLVTTKTPLETDRELEKILPEKIKKKNPPSNGAFWKIYCTAKKPKCENCKIRLECNY